MNKNEDKSNVPSLFVERHKRDSDHSAYHCVVVGANSLATQPFTVTMIDFSQEHMHCTC